MKTGLGWLSLLISLQNLWAGGNTEYLLSPKALDANELPFVPSEKPPYLLMNIPFEPIAELRETISKRENQILDHRGEAHITVIIRREGEALLKYISFDEMNQIARDNRIQDSKFEVLGVGRASAMIDSKEEHTYFLVVRSEDLLKLRRTLRDIYVARGGNSEEFDPEDFHSHITIGYTKHDLQPRDGVKFKDCRALIAGIRLK